MSALGPPPQPSSMARPTIIPLTVNYGKTNRIGTGWRNRSARPRTLQVRRADSLHARHPNTQPPGQRPQSIRYAGTKPISLSAAQSAAGKLYPMRRTKTKPIPCSSLPRAPCRMPEFTGYERTNPTQRRSRSTGRRTPLHTQFTLPERTNPTRRRSHSTGKRAPVRTQSTLPE